VHRIGVDNLTTKQTKELSQFTCQWQSVGYGKLFD